MDEPLPKPSLTLLALFATVIVATCARADEPHRLSLPVIGKASAVAGWVDFCRRYPGECTRRPMPAKLIHLDERTSALLEDVNAEVNRTVEAVSDRDHLGIEDRWDLPTDGKGDCEDIVLEKRRRLIALGLPRSALSTTIVWTPDDEGHAVLLARTDNGDLVLDHLSGDIKWWCQTRYRYVKRQSDTDESSWVSLFGEVRPDGCQP